jgi:diacylglycerol kinase family enzyme
MERLADVEHLRVSSRRSALAVSMDGEVEHLAPPLDYRIRPKALNVIAP